ncbi:MAG TPA: PilZ domain-containing protein [Syntrophobacteria bacterium]|nr:PilZ domain-containing protein [Syntrophobacteria bacterium]
MYPRIEYRTCPRASIEWPAVIMTLNGQMDGTIRNLSLSGAFIACAEMPDLDDKFVLVTQADDGMVLKLTAEKVWSANFNLDGKTVFSGVGVRFTEVSADDHQIIKSAVSQHLSRSKPTPRKVRQPAVVGL